MSLNFYNYNFRNNCDNSPQNRFVFRNTLLNPNYISIPQNNLEQYSQSFANDDRNSNSNNSNAQTSNYSDLMDDKIYISNNNKYQHEIFEKIVCPMCKNHCYYENENNYNLHIICRCGHDKIYTLIEYRDALNNFTKKIECNSCSKIIDENFCKYCLSCKSDLCLECLKKYYSYEHELINYSLKDFYCLEHGEQYNSFCFDCQTDICPQCEYGHINHKINDYFIDIKTIEHYLEEVKNFYQQYLYIKNNSLEYLFTKFDIIDKSFMIFTQFLNSFKKYRNQETINCQNMFKMNPIKDLKKIINASKANNIFKIFGSIIQFADKFLNAKSNNSSYKKGNNKNNNYSKKKQINIFKAKSVENLHNKSNIKNYEIKKNLSQKNIEINIAQENTNLIKKSFEFGKINEIKIENNFQESIEERLIDVSMITNNIQNPENNILKEGILLINEMINNNNNNSNSQSENDETINSEPNIEENIVNKMSNILVNNEPNNENNNEESNNEINNNEPINKNDESISTIDSITENDNNNGEQNSENYNNESNDNNILYHVFVYNEPIHKNNNNDEQNSILIKNEPYIEKNKNVIVELKNYLEKKGSINEYINDGHNNENINKERINKIIERIRIIYSNNENNNNNNMPNFENINIEPNNENQNNILINENNNINEPNNENMENINNSRDNENNNIYESYDENNINEPNNENNENTVNLILYNENTISEEQRNNENQVNENENFEKNYEQNENLNNNNKSFFEEYNALYIMKLPNESSISKEFETPPNKEKCSDKSFENISSIKEAPPSNSNSKLRKDVEELFGIVRDNDINKNKKVLKLVQMNNIENEISSEDKIMTFKKHFSNLSNKASEFFNHYKNIFFDLFNKISTSVNTFWNNLYIKLFNKIQNYLRENDIYIPSNNRNIIKKGGTFCQRKIKVINEININVDNVLNKVKDNINKELKRKYNFGKFINGIICCLLTKKKCDMIIINNQGNLFRLHLILSHYCSKVIYISFLFDSVILFYRKIDGNYILFTFPIDNICIHNFKRYIFRIIELSLSFDK